MRRTGMSSRLHSPRYNRLQRSTALVVLALSLALFGRSVPAGAQIPGALNISLTASPARAAVGDTVSFDLSASPPSVRDARLTSVVLDFGDGASSALRGPFDAGEQVSRTRDHRYSAPGDYTATVTATASNGDSNSATQTVSITGGNQPPIGGLDVSLTASPTSVPAGQAVSFRLSASPPSVRGGAIVSLSLDFGDGAAVNIAGPFAEGERVVRTRDHSYATSGDYTATLSASASNGETKSATQTVHVTGGQPIGGLTVNLTASPPTAAPGQLVTLNLSASPPSVEGGAIADLVVAFGDGDRDEIHGPFAAGEQVTRTRDHAYLTPGDYTASVTATASNGATGTATQTITVAGNQPQPPIGGLTVNLTASPTQVSTDQLVSFNASASPPSVLGGQITSMALDFGDGTTADLGNGAIGDQVTRTTTHAYGAGGTYTAVLTVRASNGASRSANQTITVAGSPAPEPVPVPGPLPGGMSISYAAGWNIVAGPANTVVSGSSGTLYTLPGGSGGYQVVPAGVSLTPGQGYWAFFPDAAVSTIPFIGPQTVAVTLPAGQWVMIGNPGSAPATVSGADVVYTYATGPGYQATTVLQPGQGAWAISFNGSIATISNP